MDNASCFCAAQYAGNVLVYGAISPCDGDWFGGINASNAAVFMEGLINAEVCPLHAASPLHCIRLFPRKFATFLHTWLALSALLSQSIPSPQSIL